MSTSVESNSIISKFEVNSNTRIDDENELGDRAEPDGKVVAGVKCNSVICEVENEMQSELNEVEERNHRSGEGKHNNVSAEESVSGSQVHVNGGETLNSMDPKMNAAEISVVVNGEGTPDEACPSPAGGCDSPAGVDSLRNDNRKVSSESPISQEHHDGLDEETDSIDSGKSPKKKKGFLSGGLHIHMPKFSSRLSFGSDVSATSTGSDPDVSPEKKKKKKDKKNRKKQTIKTNDLGDQGNATPSEYSESIASDRVGLDQLDGTVSLNDTGLDSQLETQEELASGGGDDLVSSNAKETGDTVDPSSSDAVEIPSPGPVPTADTTEPDKTEEMEMKVDVTPQETESTTTADTEPENKTEISLDQSSMPSQSEEVSNAPSSPDALPTSEATDQSAVDQDTPPQAVEESKPEDPPIDQVEQSIASPGDSSSPKEGDEETGEEKKASTSSGDEGEEEDEGEVEEGKQKKKKKRKGILNIHFPHFGAKKGNTGEKSSDQSSDSDRALSPKRFGWMKRKDARSPDRKGDKEEEPQVEEKEKPAEATAEATTAIEEPKQQEGETQSVGVTASLDVAIQGPDVAVSSPETSATLQGSVDVDIRPEEKVLVDCAELVKDEGDNQEFESTGEDFTTTDALLEQIAETITSIEKAQNLRASQVMDVNVLADTAPEGKEEEDGYGLDLQADIPSQVDEQGINIPSAQIILAVPTESTLLEVSEEDRSDVQPIDIDGD
nr:claspin-like [Lytechinus pictus]